jgi:lactate racemase
MLETSAVAPDNELLTSEKIQQVLHDGLSGRFRDARVLVLIPDHTRTMPLPRLFREMVAILHDTKKLDFLVALGTHPPLDEPHLNKLVGISAEERRDAYKHIGILNHTWDDKKTMLKVATIPQNQVKEIAGDLWHPSLGGDVPVNINRAVCDYDHVLILGPTFPHEVVGFSGGAKYLFPGISGPEMINVTHWLGALGGVIQTIGVKDTPVRRLVHAAAAFVPTPITLIALIVATDELAGMFIGDYESAWSAAADLSAQRHIRTYEKPFKRVLSAAPKMYDELWTAGKAMYKLDPVVADGGEVIIYAPHLKEISRVHGKHIEKVGYHVVEYFLEQWDRFKDVPLGVLAHSSHVRGGGRFEDGKEQPRIQVTLASKLSEDDCKRLTLGYMNPDDIDVDDWKDREDEGILYVPKAGETLYRAKQRAG